MNQNKNKKIQMTTKKSKSKGPGVFSLFTNEMKKWNKSDGVRKILMVNVGKKNEYILSTRGIWGMIIKEKTCSIFGAWDY